MKKLLIAGGALIIVGILVYLVATDNSNSKKLDEEVAYFVENGYYKSEIVTTGQWAKVERLLKNDYKNIEEVSGNIQNYVIEDYLTPTNYSEDGQDFAKTKEAFSDMKVVMERDINDLKSLLIDGENDLKANEAKLNDAGRDKYKELLKKSNIENVISKLEQKKTIIENKIVKATEILDFVLENKNRWRAIDGEFTALDDNFKVEYDKLIEEIMSIGK